MSSSLLGLLFISAQANAASACKGLENNACVSKESCSWIKGYERKDGKTVKPFCRTKPGSKAKASVKTAANTTSVKTKKAATTK